ncbi:MAG TPA: inositol monophosphatase family protein [Nitrosospira sp.]|nr:inositol monophosphatase family protein [Nitrosospira sp.]
MTRSPGNLPSAHALAFAQRLADAARPLALRYFRTSPYISFKADNTPVTVADREIEAMLRRRIQEEYPGHGVTGEEYDGGIPDTDYTWVLDPIDGTRSFIVGNPLFGTLIGLLEHRCPFIGLIDCPAMGERWWGDGMHTVYYNGLEEQAAGVSRHRSVEHARLYLPYHISQAGHPRVDEKNSEERQAIGELSNRALVSQPVCDCYAYGLLASGHCDLVIETGLEPSDYLPLIPVVKGAGGQISDWKGNPLGHDSDGRVVAAASEELADAAIEILSYA